MIINISNAKLRTDVISSGYAFVKKYLTIAK